MLVHNHTAASSSPKVQTCVTFAGTQMCMYLQNLQPLSGGTCCYEAQCEAETSTTPFMLTFVYLLIHRISSISPDSTGVVIFSLCGGVLSRQQPVRGAMRVLHVRSTLGAAEERGAEACADWPSKQYKHDAVGCSLRGVANSLLGPNKIIY